KTSSPKSRQRPPELLAQFVTPASGPSYFDITPSSTPTPSSKKSSGYTTKTPGRRPKRTPAQSISSTITNGASTSRRVSCTNTDTASQNSSSYLDEQDVEIDENSFYVHLQKMQERYLAQQEPGWLKSQHALLQAKHRGPGNHYHHDQRGSGSSSRGLLPGSQFLSRINSGSSSPNGSDYSSSPSFHPHMASRQHRGSSTSFHHQRLQPIQPYNCFQPGNVICVPRERSLGGLIFHKTFVDTHILTPSPYFRGQYLTLDHKVVEIDKDSIKEISGFAHPRTVQILSEETVYNSSSQKPTRVLILDRPLEGDGVVFSRPFDGPVMPSLRKFASDMAFLESLPELNRALQDFHNLCQEFENTYVYIRGFATYTLDKLRLIYDKAYHDCLGDSVKLQKLIMRGIQAEQDCFAELMENVVLGKLYQKLFIHSLVPCYAQRDVEADAMILRYHQYLFSVGGHRGLEGGACLASSDGPLLQETLRKLGLSEKLRTMRVDHALERAAGLFKAWDQEIPAARYGSAAASSVAFAAKQKVGAKAGETEQEMRRRQLRESLRIIVQDERMSNERTSPSNGLGSPQSDDDDNEDDEETGPWNTPLEKVYCIKQVLDAIAAAAEDHLMHGQGVGFVQKKRSEVSVTTDDFIPLLALVIVQARMLRLGSNIFYLQRFRINTPKSDLNFALVTFEASVEFLKSDPLGLLEASSVPTAPFSADSSETTPVRKSIDFDLKSPSEEVHIMPWGTPSHTGWGFSPPKTTTFTPAFDVMPPTPGSESEPLLSPSADTSPTRPLLASRYSDQQFQQRHARSVSMNFDDRFRKLGYNEELGSGSSTNSSWSRSPLLGPRFSSGANSPLASPNITGSGSTESNLSLGRRQSHATQIQVSQRHSISTGHSHAYPQHHLHRISVEQGRETMNRSTILPLSANMTPHLVVKPQIMLPPPTTPPMSGQNTTGRTRPMSMIVAGALASSAYSNSYSGPSSGNIRSRASSSNNSSPATSPRLGPGKSRQSSTRSNSLMSGPFPMLRANSLSSVLTNPTPESDKNGEASEPMSPVSPSSPWLPKTQGRTPALSSSPMVLTESPVMAAVTTSTPSRPQTPEGSKRLSGTHNLTRIRTSPSSTTSSISTPTTPTTFSPSSSNALLDSLATSAHLASPNSSQGSEASRRKSVHGESSTDSSVAGSVRSRSSTGRGSLRLSFPKLAPSPSAPSTVFCKTTVTANGASSEILEATLPPPPPPRFMSEPARSAPEIPTLSSLAQSGSQYTRARSPAISMANSPFVFTDLGKDVSNSSTNSSSGNSSPVVEQKEESPKTPSVEKMPEPKRMSSLIKSGLTNTQQQQHQSLSSSVTTDSRGTCSKASQSLSSLPTAVSSSVSPLASSLNASLPSLPTAGQPSSFQYSRQAAPEIISLASPLTGSVVIRTSSPDKSMASSGYTPSYEALRHGSNGSLSMGHGFGSTHSPSRHSMDGARHSMDGARPSSGLGYYGTNSSTSSFGTSGEFHHHRQSSPMPNAIPRPQSSQHPLSGSSHQRQHSASATPYLSMVTSSSFTTGGPLGRGLGIHTLPNEGTTTRKKMMGPHDRRASGTPESWSTPILTSNMTSNTLSPSSSGSSTQDNDSETRISWTPASGEEKAARRESVHVKMDSGKYVQQLPPPPPPGQGSDYVRATAVEYGFKDEFTLNGSHIMSESRRGSTTSLRGAILAQQQQGDLAASCRSPTPVLQQDPQLRTQMMGEFLSELAKVEDGDVLVGGRHGVLGRR
ncbi:hypothetical protein BGZ81_009299, partial [Podila clonocystis]